MNEILGKDCCGQDIIPIPGKRLSQHTNRHPNTDGTSWGWVDGCTLNICWSNNKSFNGERCSALIQEYNNRKDAEHGR
jgi:hypothetical protein